MDDPRIKDYEEQLVKSLFDQQCRVVDRELKHQKERFIKRLTELRDGAEEHLGSNHGNSTSQTLMSYRVAIGDALEVLALL